MRRRHVNVLIYHTHETPTYASLVRAPRNRVTLRLASKPEEAAALIADTDVLFAWKFPPALYARAGRLAWLQVMGAGGDWALVPELPPRVAVTRAPGIFGPWMAEYVLGWALWVTQRMRAYTDAQRERRWIASVLPDRLRGKTLAIVGVGDIGRTIARAAGALGMRVVGVSRSGHPVAGVARVYPRRALARALGDADFVVLTVPLTPDTHRLIGARELAAMRPTAWLMNVARGAVVDDRALLDALEGGRIGGAILDVFVDEPLPAAHPLWHAPNIVVTPHISGPSLAAEIAPVFNDNLARFLAGRPLRHRLERARGY